MDMTHHPLLNDIKKNTAPLVLDGFHNLQAELIGKTLATSGQRVRLALVLGAGLGGGGSPVPRWASLQQQTAVTTTIFTQPIPNVKIIGQRIVRATY